MPKLYLSFQFTFSSQAGVCGRSDIDRLPASVEDRVTEAPVSSEAASKLPSGGESGVGCSCRLSNSPELPRALGPALGP